MPLTLNEEMVKAAEENLAEAELSLSTAKSNAARDPRRGPTRTRILQLEDSVGYARRLLSDWQKRLEKERE